MIGDSMFSGGEVKIELDKLANHKVTIENHAVGGASFHEGWEQSIPAQYASLNITDNPPRPSRSSWMAVATMSSPSR
jgi:hypothetical protein